MKTTLWFYMLAAIPHNIKAQNRYLDYQSGVDVDYTAYFMDLNKESTGDVCSKRVRQEREWWGIKTKNVWKGEEPQGRSGCDTVIYDKYIFDLRPVSGTNF